MIPTGVKMHAHTAAKIVDGREKWMATTADSDVTLASGHVSMVDEQKARSASE